MHSKTLALSFLTFLLSLPVLAQEPITLTKINLPIVLDGYANEPAWEEVPYFDAVQYEPIFKGEMSELTKFKVAYDNSYIYVLGELYTDDPSSITTNSLARDQYSSDDVFAIIIDGFNDNQNASWFFTNPDGVRFDFAISNDANSAGGRNPINSSWNTFWDVETAKSDEGWFVEMKIPFSSIGVQINENNETEMGIIVYRWITSKNERHIFPAIPPNWNLGNAKPSQAQDVLLSGVKSTNPVYFTPYGLMGINRLSSLNSDSSAYTTDRDGQAEIGFDVKYNITNNLTLDLTVNTDFAQVEADDQQLNLSRFSVFFPEKRQFFQQRSGLFEYSFGRDRVFYSRRIGLDGDGNPVRILGGGRVTGRIGSMDIGVINMQTADTDNQPSENFGVIRLQQQVINQNSYVGGIFTSRVGADGSSNLVYGIDGVVNTFGDHIIEIRTAQSIDDELSSSDRYDIGETSAIRLGARNQTTNGVLYELMYSRFGDNYDPKLGFVRVGGIVQKFGRIGYGWIANEESIFQRHSLRIFYYGRFYNEGHELLNFEESLQDRSINMDWNSRFKQLGNFSLQYSFGKENIPLGEDFDLLGQILVPAGDYDDTRLRLRYRFSESWKVGGGINTSIGEIYGGNIKELSIDPRFFLSSKLEIGGSYRLTHLTFSPITGRTKNEYTSHLGQMRGQYSFNKKAQISTFIQYSNTSERVGANIRFRYNFSEGRDLWLVVNEIVSTVTTPVEVGLPNQPKILSGSLLIKYNHTFSF